MSNTTYNAVDNIIPKTELYVCETCGKKVYERYGSNRFCCVTCARKYSSRFGNSKESRRKKSETLKKRYPSKPKSISPKKKSSKQKKSQSTCFKRRLMLFSLSIKLHSFNYNTLHIQLPTNVECDIINGGVFILTEMLKNWTIFDLYALLKLNKNQNLYLYANLFNLKDSPKFIPPRQYNRIKTCRNALNKQLINGSITFEDQNLVVKQCEHLLYTDNWSSSKVCSEYLKLDKYSIHTLQSIGVTTRNLSKAVSLYCTQIKHKKLKSNYEQYKKQCQFNFSKKMYQLLIEVEKIKDYNWYNAKNQNHDYLSRDHMISISYGYYHNIDPYLISHPANCRLISQRENESKNDNCSITVLELIERVEWFNETILAQSEKLHTNEKFKTIYTPSNIFTKKELKIFYTLSLID